MCIFETVNIYYIYYHFQNEELVYLIKNWNQVYVFVMRTGWVIDVIFPVKMVQTMVMVSVNAIGHVIQVCSVSTYIM
jgi:hypothetical protein